MTLPAVTITELDGALGILPPSAGRLFALVGVSSSGPLNTPATYARIKDLVADLGVGPLVEAAAHSIEKYGRPVVVVRTGQTNAGDYGAIDDAGVTGTSVVTAAATEPLDDYEVIFQVVSGGTIGVAGITLRYSLDGGRTFSPVTALGTADSFAISGTGVEVDFAAGTLVAADAFSFRTTAPRWDLTELADGLEALKNTAAAWELVQVVGDCDGDALDAIDLKITGMAQVGKYHAFIASFRMPDEGESEASYLSAFAGEFGSKATVHGAVCAGASRFPSSVSGRRFRRPVAFTYAAREASVSEEVNVADINLGTLPGSIRDRLGNPEEHDEAVNPGLDDARAVTLRTWDGVAGVYVTRPRLLSPEGSDFHLLPHRRVLNLAAAALRGYFLRRLNKPVRVDKVSGFILEEDAREIESGANAALRSVLLAKPKASASQFVLSRTDNLLSTKTLTGQARVTPLAYPEFIELDLGFLNPALQVQAA